MDNALTALTDATLSQAPMGTGSLGAISEAVTLTFVSSQENNLCNIGLGYTSEFVFNEDFPLSI